MNTDQLLFKELDKHSAALRSKAEELANLFGQLPVRSPEIDETITALKKVHSMPIDHLDQAINDLKDAFLKLNLKIGKNSRLVESPVFHTILEKNLWLVKEVHALEAKALELNRACLD